MELVSRYNEFNIFSKKQLEKIILEKENYFILLGNGINYFFEIENYQLKELGKKLNENDFFYSCLEKIKEYNYKYLWNDILDISERINSYIDENNPANFVDNGNMLLEWNQSEINKNFLDYNGEDTYSGDNKKNSPEYKNFEYWLRRIEALIGLLEQLNEVYEANYEDYLHNIEIDWDNIFQNESEIIDHQVFHLVHEIYKISSKYNNNVILNDECDLGLLPKYIEDINQILNFLNDLKIYYKNSVLKILLVKNDSNFYKINYSKFNTFIDNSSKVFTLNYDLMMEEYFLKRDKKNDIEHLHGKFYQFYEKKLINGIKNTEFDEINKNICMEGFYFLKSNKCADIYEKFFKEFLKIKNIIIFGVDTRGDLQILHYLLAKIIKTNNYELKIYFGIFVDKQDQIYYKIVELINLIKSFYQNKWIWFYGLSDDEEKLEKNIDKALKNIYFYDSNVLGNFFKS